MQYVKIQHTILDSWLQKIKNKGNNSFKISFIVDIKLDDTLMLRIQLCICEFLTIKNIKKKEFISKNDNSLPCKHGYIKFTKILNNIQNKLKTWRENPVSCTFLRSNRLTNPKCDTPFQQINVRNICLIASQELCIYVKDLPLTT